MEEWFYSRNTYGTAIICTIVSIILMILPIGFFRVLGVVGLIFSLIYFIFKALNLPRS